MYHFTPTLQWNEYCADIKNNVEKIEYQEKMFTTY